VFAIIEKKPQGKTCVAIVAAAQAVEHYEPGHCQ
jgi:hypothetical protein